MILRHIFSPPNNTRLGNLCGPTDAHLRSIEAALEVRIAHRHEQFKVDGPKAKAQRAMDMLQGSFDMQLAVLRNLQASVLAYTILRPGLRCCPL